MKDTAAAIACLAWIGSSGAAIAPGTSGNGELFFNAVDDLAQVSYVLDLGVQMDAFFVDAQQDAGLQRFWAVDSANWAGFLSQVNTANLRWSVVGIDSTGNNQPASQRLFTTVRQGNEAAVGNTSNQQLSLGIGATQAGNFFNSVNTKGTHPPSFDFAVHGDSIGLASDAEQTYYGKTGGLTATYNGNAQFNATNALGQSSWFYYLTRSSTSQLTTAKVLIDEFDNGTPGTGNTPGPGFDAYWGFTFVNATDPSAPFYDPTSPYAGKYLLSYTLPVYDVRTTSAFRQFAQGIGRTEFSGAMQVTALTGAAAASAFESSAGWTVALGAVSPVAEPSTIVLWAGGAAALLLRRGRLRIR